MKTIINIFLFFSLLFTFSCSQSQTIHAQKWMMESGKVKILSTTEMINDLVSAVGGEHVDCLTLIFGGLDPHSYELVKGDDEKFSRADIVFSNGLGLEHGACLVNTIQNHPNSIALGDEVKKKFPNRILTTDGAIDPHIWMDVSLWLYIIDPIEQSLSKLDPDHARSYKKNAENLKKRLLRVHSEILDLMQSIPAEKRYLVTSHDAFYYFAKAYLAENNEKTEWKERFCAPEGLAPDNQMSSLNIVNIINHLKKFNIKVLFPESNVSRDSIKKIILAGKQKDLNLKISDDPLYGDSMEIVETIPGENYIKMMKHNADVICKQIKKN